MRLARIQGRCHENAHLGAPTSWETLISQYSYYSPSRYSLESLLHFTYYFDTLAIVTSLIARLFPHPLSIGGVFFMFYCVIHSVTFDNRLSDIHTVTMYDNLIETLVEAKAWKATKFISEKEIIRAVRTRYKSGFNRYTLEITITRGKPNYREREFIQACKKAGEPFPIKKPQLKYIPDKKTKPSGASKRIH